MSWQDPPPDPTNPDLLDNLRTHLINLSLVRDPRDGSQPSLPPMWIDPRFGVPAPGQDEGINPVEVGQNMVVALRDATDMPPGRYEGFMRLAHVEIIFFARTAPPAKSLENRIRAAINDRRGWTMEQVPVNESLLFRGFQLIRSDQFGYLFTEEYQFNLWGPFTPVDP